MSNAPVINRAYLLERLETQRSSWDALVARLSDEQQTLPTTLGDWSVKDLIAHLAYYEGRTARRIRHIIEGEPEDPLDLTFDQMPDDERNQFIRKHAEADSLRDVRVVARLQFESLLRAVAQLEDADLAGTSPRGQTLSVAWGLDEPPLTSIEGETYSHYAEHRPALEGLVDRLQT
jgi:uncharacterized damage-inducible protein DinB